MKKEIEKQIKLERELKKILTNGSGSEKYNLVYDLYHKFILKYGFPREGRKKDGFLYAPQGYKNYAEELIYHLVPSQKKVLEIGVGDGRLSYRLAQKKKCQVIGIDISELALSIASQFLKNSIPLQYIKADARDLPFPEESFDIVISKDVLEHLPEKDHLIHFQEVKRVLRRDGYYLLFTPPKLGSQGEGLHFKEYTLEGLFNFLKLNFKKIEIYSVQLMALGILFKVPKWLLKIIDWYEFILAKTKIYKFFGPLNKFLIFRGVFRLQV